MTDTTAQPTQTIELFADMQAFITLNEQRTATYSLLSRLFLSEVDQPLLDELYTMRFPACTGNDQVDEGYRLLAAYLNGAWENSVTELEIDYVRVFIGHGIDAFSAAYPFESAYTSEKRLLMQEARDEVLAIYRSAGLLKKDAWKEGEDHIGIELEYEQVLSKRVVEALKKGDESVASSIANSQKNFLEDHLLAWTPMMTADMRRFAQTDFYQGLSLVTEGFLVADYEFLTEITRES